MMARGGRLLRSTSDRGVTILDARVVTKRYGAFIAAPCHVANMQIRRSFRRPPGERAVSRWKSGFARAKSLWN